MATTRSPDAPPQTADPKERRAKLKIAVKFASEELHAIRPQPRADQIELILDQIRTSPDDPPVDDKSARAKARELFDKAFPKAA